MSSGVSYNPPLEDLAIFDPSVFIYDDTALTQQSALNNFLTFPTAQGTETFGDLISTGTATLNKATFINGASSSSIQQAVASTLTIDNNHSTSGTIAFKVNNSSSIDTSVLTLTTNAQTANNTTPSAVAGLYTGQTLTINNAPVSLLDATGTSGQFSQSSGRTYLYNRATPTSFTNPTTDVGTIIMRTMTTTGQFQDIAVFQQPSISLYRSLILQNTSPSNQIIFSQSGGLIQFSDASQQTTAYTGPLNMPYYQSTFLFPNLVYGRSANIYFNFSGVAWGVNDFFTINFRYSVNTTSPSANTNPTTDYTTITGTIDIYPYRCPSNIGTDTPYGIGANTTTPTNYPQLNNNIYNTASVGYINSYVVPIDATYSPRGRYYWVSNYNITQQGTAYSTTSGLLPIVPFVPLGTGDQQRFGLGIWNYLTGATATQNNQIFIELTHRGINQPITILADYLIVPVKSNTTGF